MIMINVRFLNVKMQGKFLMGLIVLAHLVNISLTFTSLANLAQTTVIIVILKDVLNANSAFTQTIKHVVSVLITA